MHMVKMQQLSELAKRRRENTPKGFKSISDYYNGAYDCDFVSPYSKSAGNLDAKVMVVLQDWCSDDYLSQPFNHNLEKHGLEPSLPTSRNLEKRLNEYFSISLDETYGTNLFPFVKQGKMTSRLPITELKKTAKIYTLPEIYIIKPKCIIAFGLSTYNALLAASIDEGYIKDNDIKSVKNLNDAINQPINIVFNAEYNVWIFAQSHSGGLGTASRNRGGVDRVRQDWSIMKSYINDLNLFGNKPVGK